MVIVYDKAESRETTFIREGVMHSPLELGARLNCDENSQDLSGTRWRSAAFLGSAPSLIKVVFLLSTFLQTVIIVGLYKRTLIS